MEEQMAAKLVCNVFGQFGPQFPKPLGSLEAGLCANGVQRRYLWIDAFGILALIGLTGEYPQALDAAKSLVRVTEACLGQPRDLGYQMLRNENNATGYVGLRIGKLRENKDGTSDAGMELDGMYWHYLDKWIFALVRLGQALDNVDFVHRAGNLAKETFAYFFKDGQGMFWKLTNTMQPIPGLPATPALDDMLSARIVFSCIDCELQRRGLPRMLVEETAKLGLMLQGVRATSTTDSLGWGLRWWAWQWTRDDALKQALMRDAPAATALPSPENFLPFRLFGSTIGAKLSKEPALVAVANAQLEIFKSVLDLEENGNSNPLKSINNVMHAVAIVPTALERKPWEKLL